VTLARSGRVRGSPVVEHLIERDRRQNAFGPALELRGTRGGDTLCGLGRQLPEPRGELPEQQAPLAFLPANLQAVA